MQKTFYEVFEKIELPAHLSDLAEEIVIEKLVAIPENKKLKVHLQSKRLIARKDIHALEYEIHKQIFRGTSSLRVEICETFTLSEYYTAESVYQAYRESILEDMMEIGKLDYHIIASADVSFENGNKVIFTIQDTVVSRDRQAQLVKELNDIFNRRCGIDARIEIAFKEPEFNKYKEEEKISDMKKRAIELLNKRNVSLFIGVDGMAKSQNLSRKTVTSKGTFDIVKFKIKKMYTKKEAILPLLELLFHE